MKLRNLTAFGLLCASMTTQVMAVECNSLTSNSSVLGTGKPEYFISGVIQQSGTNEINIKTIHSILASDTAFEAGDKFKRDALAEYPGYTLVNILISPVDEFKPECKPSL